MSTIDSQALDTDTGSADRTERQGTRADFKSIQPDALLGLARLLGRQAAIEAMRLGISEHAIQREFRPMTTPLCRLPRLLAIDEIARHLDVCTKTVRRWIERGELHVHRLGRQLRVSEEDLAAFISKRRK